MAKEGAGNSKQNGVYAVSVSSVKTNNISVMKVGVEEGKIVLSTSYLELSDMKGLGTGEPNTEIGNFDYELARIRKVLEGDNRGEVNSKHVVLVAHNEIKN